MTPTKPKNTANLSLGTPHFRTPTSGESIVTKANQDRMNNATSPANAPVDVRFVAPGGPASCTAHDAKAETTGPRPKAEIIRPVRSGELRFDAAGIIDSDICGS